MSVVAMRFILPWIAVCGAIITGRAFAPRAPTPYVGVAVFVLVVLVLGAVAAVVVTSVGRRPRVARIWLLVVAMIAGGLRGFAAEGLGLQDEWSGTPRDRTRGVKELEVQWASLPGPRCVFVARDPVSRFAAEVQGPSSACPLSHGQRIRVPWPIHFSVQSLGSVSPAERAASQGVDTLGEVEFVWPIGKAPAGYWAWVAEVRTWVWDSTRGDEPRAFLGASLLGLGPALSSESRAELRRSGLGHLVAVSGMNVGLAAWVVQGIVLRLVLRFGGTVTAAVLLSWLPVVGYVGLTGVAAPAVRAAIMFGLVGLASVVGRPGHGIHALVVSATLMLAYRPAWVVDPGFQLSLAAMGALLRTPPDASVLEQTWRVTWAVTPFGIMHFGMASPYGVLANLVAVPVFSLWVAPLGSAGWCLAPWLGAIALEPASWGARAILDVATATSTLPAMPLSVLLWAGGVSVLGRVLLRGGDGRWHRILPTWWSSVATVGAILWIARPVDVSRAQWFALGPPGRASVIAFRPESEDACLIDPRGSSARWLRVLPALGVSKISSITGKRAKGPAHDELVRALAEQGLLRSGPSVCSAPAATFVDQALRACVRRGADPSESIAAVTGVDDLECYMDDRWVPVALRFDREPHTP